MLDRLKQWSVKIWKRAPLPPTSDMSAGPIREMNPNDFQLQKPLRLIFNKNTMSITNAVFFVTLSTSPRVSALG
ncbi:hypothetical protein M8J77_004904 [Diaphorina citri]|nr:hypothetical protein M8J77_004904 [Diaphorina citri]